MQTYIKCYCVSVNCVLLTDRMYILFERTKKSLCDVAFFLACLHFQDSTTAELRITQ